MPNFAIENTLEGKIAGIDEAGRGPWAGPVVAGAVCIYDKNLEAELLTHLDDSKKLTPVAREKLYNLLFAEEQKGKLSIGIGQASVEEIDEHNILQATFMAMNRAVSSLKSPPDMAIIDGNRLPKTFPVKAQAVIGGDGKSLSIAAASIIAKVYRDHLMQELAKRYPYYAFEKNAGYGTPAHIAGIKEHGVIKGCHRFSYRPIQEALKK